MMSKEPNRLKKGRIFHKAIQDKWDSEAEGDVQPEKGIVKQNGKKGRIDIFVNDTDSDGCVVIVEIKNSDWDKMTDKAVRRNVRRQIQQIWGYIETQILAGEYVESGGQKSVSPGVLFSKRPKDAKRLKLIEGMFNEEGIAVVWEDESKEECRERNSMESS